VTTHYQWKDGSTVLATDGPVTLSDPTLVGRTITLAVTGTKPGYTADTRTATTTVAAATLTGPDPTIGGSPVFGQTLIANIGTWDAGVTTHYQWKDGSTVLATDGPVTLSDPALVGRTITLAVTGTKPGYTADTTTVTAAVSSASLTAPTPTISGTPMVGRALTATAGWGPGSVELGYTWLADGQRIAGATGSTLLLGAAELGTSITVQVTGTEAGYVTGTVASSPTITVRPGTIMTKRPTIDGTAKVGRKLTADAGHWRADGAAVDLAYKWYANGEVIRGETKAKLKLTKASDGKKITVKVIGSAEGYRTATETSKATKKVG
jgi:hypothetical protein